MGTDSIESRNNANQALLYYGYRFFKTHLLYKANQSLTTTRVWKGSQETVTAGLSKDLYLTIPRNEYNELDASLQIKPQLIAPISKQQHIGTAIIKLKGETIAQRSLVALQAVSKGSFMQVLKDEALLLLE
jgi:D-alanyl-D-alanine carboxypeptidase (penicillin-binding protein 5/6)